MSAKLELLNPPNQMVQSHTKMNPKSWRFGQLRKLFIEKVCNDLQCNAMMTEVAYVISNMLSAGDIFG